MGATVLLLVSLLFPYWRVQVAAPQYPQGLRLTICPYRISGDVREIDLLNHYIGMRPLETAAAKEQRLAIPMIVAAALCLLLAAFLPPRWAIWFILPALLFPLLFTVDLYWWLRDSGLNLDANAPLNRAVKPFIPPLLGEGKIAQFKAMAAFQVGFYLVVLAALLALLGLFFRYGKAGRGPFAGQPKSKPNVAVSTLMGVLLLLCPRWVPANTLIVGPEASSATITSALQEATAGDTIMVQGGEYAGPLLVDKSVTLLGEGQPVIDGGGGGTVVQLRAPHVVLRGFVIRNSGDLLAAEDAGVLVKAPAVVVAENRCDNVLFGIRLRQAPNSVIRDNVLSGKDLPAPRRGDLIRVWYSDGVRIENNQVSHGRDVVLWFSKHLVVRHNQVQRGRYGLHFMYCDDAIIEDNNLTENSVGAYLMYSYRLRLQHNWILNNRGPSGYGIGLKDMYDLLITENGLADNRAGIFMDNVSGVFRQNLIAYNDYGIMLFPSAQDNRFVANSFVDNGEQVVVEGQGALVSNQWQGNYWSNYNGYDADGDGVGDLPYRAVHLFEQLTQRYRALRLFAYSPATQALDLASQLFPIFAPQPTLTDETPRMSMLLPALTVPGQTRSPVWFVSSAGLFLFALILAGCLRRSPYRRVKGATHPGTVVSSPQRHTNSPKSVLSVRHLSKRFGPTVVLHDLCFTVTAGETLALWGPNGAGKSTALRCLLGILPFAGTVIVGGQDVRTQGKAARQNIGYVPQEVRLHNDLTVWESLVFYARLRAVSLDRPQALLQEWKLVEMKNQTVGSLSGGMKQKLTLAIALLSDPPILLLDEPTSNLDVKTRREFWILLENLKRDGKTLLFCSHRTDEVLRLADRVIVLEEGSQIAEGTPDELQDHLAPYTHLHVVVPRADRIRAAHILRQQGFLVHPNGIRISVRVAQDQKAAPFQALVEAAIPVLDFELGNEQEGNHC